MNELFEFSCVTFCEMYRASRLLKPGQLISKFIISSHRAIVGTVTPSYVVPCLSVDSDLMSVPGAWEL